MSYAFREDTPSRVALLPSGWVNTKNEASINNDTLSEEDLIACASPSASLITFAAVNMLTLLGAFVLGHAKFRSRLTCGLLPRPETGGSSIPHPRSFLRWTVFIPAIIMIILELLSTTIGAYLAYNTGVMTLNAMVVMALARPRGTWITIVVCYVFVKAMAALGVIKSRSMWMGNYRSSHFTMIVTEVILEIIGIIPTVYLLSTIAGAGTREAMGEPDFHTRLMYIGAIVYVNGIAISSTILGTTMYMWIRRRLDQQDELSNESETSFERRLRIVKRRRKIILLCMFAFGWIPALGSWMIWAGFVHVAKDFYCSKKLVEIAVVWIVCTFLRTLVGAG